MWTKPIEKRGKRALIALVTRLVRTRPISAQEVRDSRPRRILVVRQHNQMGDMLLATPAYRAIKESLENVRLGVVAARMNRNVLLDHPFVDDVFTYNNRDLLGTIRMIREIRSRRYDLAIVLHTFSFSFTSALIGLVSGARVRAGSSSRPFGNRLSEAFYHLELPVPTESELAGMNEAKRNLYPLRALGIDTDDLRPVMTPSSASRAWARDLVSAAAPGRRRIVVHPGAGKSENVWEPARFAAVVHALGEASAIDTWVTQGPFDARYVDGFARAARAPFTRVEGRPVGDLAALLELADLVLCNDTGIMHVSCAVGAKTLAVFGPTDPARFAPPCANLFVIRADGGDLRRLDVAPVAEKARSILAAG